MSDSKKPTTNLGDVAASAGVPLTGYPTASVENSVGIAGEGQIDIRADIPTATVGVEAVLASDSLSSIRNEFNNLRKGLGDKIVLKVEAAREGIASYQQTLSQLAPSIAQSRAGNTVINDRGRVPLGGVIDTATQAPTYSFYETMRSALDAQRMPGSKVMHAAANKAATTAGKTLTFDVENTWARDASSPMNEIVSFSFRDSASKKEGTFAHKDWRSKLQANMDYWAEQGNVNNVKLLEDVYAGLDRLPKGQLKTFNDSGFRAAVARVISGTPSGTTLQGWNSFTDVDKLRSSNFLGAENVPQGKEAIARMYDGTNMSYKVRDVAKNFKTVMAMPDKMAGYSLTSAAEIMGLLPLVGSKSNRQAHSGLSDVYDTERIGYLVNPLAAAINAGDPTMVTSMQKNWLSKAPINDINRRAKWLEHITAEQALKDVGSISAGMPFYGNDTSIFYTADDAKARANWQGDQHDKRSRELTGEVKLLSVSKPSPMVPRTKTVSQLIPEPVRLSPQEANFEEALTKGLSMSEILKVAIPLSKETFTTGSSERNLGLSDKYAAQYVASLKTAAYASGGYTTPRLPISGTGTSVESVTAEFIGGLLTDLSNAKATSVTAGGSQGHTVETVNKTKDALRNNLESSLIELFTGGGDYKNMFVTPFSTETQVDNGAYLDFDRNRGAAARLQSAMMKTVAETISRTIKGSQLPDVSKNAQLFLPEFTEENYLKPEVASMPITSDARQNRQSTSERSSSGIKAIMAHLTKASLRAGNVLSTDARLGLHNDITAGNFSSTAYTPVLTGNTITDNANSVIDEIIGRTNMKRGNAFEASSRPEDFLSSRGFSILKPVGNVTSKGNKLEHEAKLGGVVAHPDILATRVEEVDGAFKRLLHIVDVKSPTSPLPENATLKDLISGQYGKSQIEWVAQLAGYAKVAEGLGIAQDDVRVSVLHDRGKAIGSPIGLTQPMSLKDLLHGAKTGYNPRLHALANAVDVFEEQFPGGIKPGDAELTSFPGLTQILAKPVGKVEKVQATKNRIKGSASDKTRFISDIAALIQDKGLTSEMVLQGGDNSDETIAPALDRLRDKYQFKGVMGKTTDAYQWEEKLAYTVAKASSILPAEQERIKSGIVATPAQQAKSRSRNTAISLNTGSATLPAMTAAINAVEAALDRPEDASIMEPIRNESALQRMAVGEKVAIAQQKSAAEVASLKSRRGSSASIFNRFSEIASKATGMHFRGAFTEPDVAGSIGVNPLDTENWLTEKNDRGPGSQDPVIASYRRNLLQSYEARAKSVWLKQERLIHGAEARTAVDDAGMIPQHDNFAKAVGFGEDHSPAGQDKSITFSNSFKQLEDERLQNLLEAQKIRETRSLDDLLAPRREKDQRAAESQIPFFTQKAVSTKALYEEAMSSGSRVDQGKAAYNYASSLANLRNLGVNFSAAGFEPPPTRLPFGQDGRAAYTHGINLARKENALASATATGFDELILGTTTTTGEQSDNLQKQIARKELDARLAAHTQAYLSREGINVPVGIKSALLTSAETRQGTALAQANILRDFLKNNPAVMETAMPLTQEQALEEYERGQQASALKHSNSLMMATQGLSKSPLTPEILSSITGDARALLSLGKGADLQKLDLAAIISGAAKQGFDPSAKLQALQRGTSTFGDESSLYKDMNSYIRGINTELGTISPKGVNDVTNAFVATGKAIEQDLMMAKAFDAIIKSSVTAGKKPDQQLMDQRQMHLDAAEQGRKSLEGLLEGRKDRVNNYQFGADDAQYKNAHQEGILSKKEAAIDSTNKLRAMLNEGTGIDGDFLPQVISQIKANKKLGLKPGFNIDELLTNKALMQVSPKTEMSSATKSFINASQVVGNYDSGKGASGIGLEIFDAVRDKQRAALSMVKEVQNAFISLSHTKISPDDDGLVKLRRTIGDDIAQLEHLQKIARETGKTPPEMSSISSRLETNIAMLGSKARAITRPNLASPDYMPQAMMDAREDRLDSEHNIAQRALRATARVNVAVKDGKIVSHNEMEEFINASKAAQDIGLSPINYPGLKSLQQAKQFAVKQGRPYFQGQDSLNFTEQLVDMANWQMQWGGAKFALSGLSSMTVGGFKEAASFEAKMKNVELVAQANPVQMQGLQGQVTNLSTTFQVSPTQLSEGLVVLGQAGYKAAESLQLIGPIAQLATATLSDLKEAADITTTVLMSFDQPVASVVAVTNTLAAATIESKLELSSLGTTLNYIASTAYTAGMSLEETSTAMGLMSNAGVRASTIGTSLRSILGVLIAPTAAFREELGRVGISMDEVNPRANSMASILQKMSSKGFNVENAFSGLDKRIAGNLTTLLSQADKWENFQSKITDTDTGSRMAYGQMDTFEGQSKRLSNTYDLTRIAATEGTLVPLKVATRWAADTLTGVEHVISSPTGQTAAKFVAGGAALLGTTAIMSLGTEALLTGIPALFTGIRQNLGQKLSTGFVHLAEDSTALAWLSKPADVTRLSPRRIKLHDNIASLGSMLGSPIGLAAAAAVGGIMWGSNELQQSDLPWGYGLKRAKRAAEIKDTFSSIAQVLDASVEQQFKINTFNRGPTEETATFNRSLALSGFLTATDREGKLVNIDEYKKAKRTDPLTTVLGANEFSASIAAQTTKSYTRQFVSPIDMEALANSGNKQYSTYDKVKTADGQQAVEAAADKALAELKDRGDFYSTSRTSDYLSKYFGSSSAFDRSVQSTVLGKQEVALKAPNAKEMEAAASKDAFISTAQEYALRSNLDSGLNKQARATTELTLWKSTLGQLRGENKDFDDAMRNGSTGKYALKLEAQLEKGKISTGDFFSQLDEMYSDTRGKDLGSAKLYAENRKAYTSVDTMQGLRNRLTTLGAEYYYTNPQEADTEAKFSTAKQQHAEKSVKSLTDAKELQQSILQAEKELASTTIGSEKYAAQKSLVDALKASLESMLPTLRNLAETSKTFNIPGVDIANRTLLKDAGGAYAALRMPENGSRESMVLGIPTIHIEDWASKARDIESKYRRLMANIAIKNSPEAVETLEVSKKLEFKLLTEGLLEGVKRQLTPIADQIKQAIHATTQSDTAFEQINLEALKLNTSLNTSNLLKENLPHRPVYFDDAYRKDFTENEEYFINVKANLDNFNVSVESAKNVLALSLSEIDKNYAIDKKVAVSSSGSTSEESINEFGKAGLLVAEEKYHGDRIAKNQQALSTISGIIQEEIRQRDSLIKKIGEANSAQAASDRSFGRSIASAEKDAGTYKKKDGQYYESRMGEIVEQAQVYERKGDVKGFNEKRAEAVELQQQAKSDAQSRPTLGRLADLMKYLEDSTGVTYNNESRTRSELLGKNEQVIAGHVVDYRASLDAVIKDKEAQKLITGERASTLRSRLDEAITANAGNPTRQASVLQQLAGNEGIYAPRLNETLTLEESMSVLDKMVKTLSGSFSNLNDLIAGKGGTPSEGSDSFGVNKISGTNVTPTKEQVQRIVGKTAWKELELDNGLPQITLNSTDVEEGTRGSYLHGVLKTKTAGAQTLIHELAHSALEQKSLSTGKPIGGEGSTEAEKYMVSEAYAAKMAGEDTRYFNLLSDFTPLNTSKEQRDAIMASPMAEAYRTHIGGALHSLNTSKVYNSPITRMLDKLTGAPASNFSQEDNEADFAMSLVTIGGIKAVGKMPKLPKNSVFPFKEVPDSSMSSMDLAMEEQMIADGWKPVNKRYDRRSLRQAAVDRVTAGEQVRPEFRPTKEPKSEILHSGLENELDIALSSIDTSSIGVVPEQIKYFKRTREAIGAIKGSKFGSEIQSTAEVLGITGTIVGLRKGYAKYRYNDSVDTKTPVQESLTAQNLASFDRYTPVDFIPGTNGIAQTDENWAQYHRVKSSYNRRLEKLAQGSSLASTPTTGISSSVDPMIFAQMDPATRKQAIKDWGVQPWDLLGKSTDKSVTNDKGFTAPTTYTKEPDSANGQVFYNGTDGIFQVSKETPTGVLSGDLPKKTRSEQVNKFKGLMTTLGDVNPLEISKVEDFGLPKEKSKLSPTEAFDPNAEMSQGTFNIMSMYEPAKKDEIKYDPLKAAQGLAHYSLEPGTLANAASGGLDSTMVATITNSNLALVTALTNLTSALSSQASAPGVVGGTSQTGATQQAPNGVGTVQVSVNAPVSVTTENGGGRATPGDMTKIVIRLCEDYFNNQFPTAYKNAINSIDI